MGRCPSCGEEAGDGLFCGGCGARTPEEPVAPPPTEALSAGELVDWRCSQCGVDNESEARFCYACGAPAPSVPAETLPSAPPAPETWACASCGAVGDADAEFCHACGTQRPRAGTSAAATVAGPIQRAPAPPDWEATQSSSPPPHHGQSAAPRDPGRPSRLLWLIAAVVIVALAAGGVAYVLARGNGLDAPPVQAVSADSATSSTGTGAESGSEPSPGSGASSATSSEDTAAYLQSVETLIVQAGRGRHGIADATARFAAHKMSASKAASLIQGVIDNRTAVLGALKSMSPPADAEAASCRQAFMQAMKYSVAADAHYLDWVNGSASISTADTDNGHAGAWKSKFISIYNRLARENGMSYGWKVADI